MRSRPRIRRVQAGLYELAGTDRLIVRTDEWEGPRGGSHSLWEIAHRERGNIVIDSTMACRTLREARTWLIDAAPSDALTPASPAATNQAQRDHPDNRKGPS